jgi:hypothetical protein
VGLLLVNLHGLLLRQWVVQLVAMLHGSHRRQGLAGVAWQPELGRQLLVG